MNGTIRSGSVLLSAVLALSGALLGANVSTATPGKSEASKVGSAVISSPVGSAPVGTSAVMSASVVNESKSSVVNGAVTKGLVGTQALTVASSLMDSFTRQVFDLMNVERAKVGARQLVWNQSVANVSQDWANQTGAKMQNGSFDFNQVHRADGGGSLIPAGASWYREIIGFNFTPSQIVNWWLNSPSHRAAMLDPKATDVGVGYVVPSSGSYAGWSIVVSNLAAYASTKPPVSGGVSYAGHVQNVGWQAAVGSGGAAGTTGQALRLESLRFDSTGQRARAHVENVGWQEYRSGSAAVGTTGQGLRMEAVQVSSTVPGQSIRCQAHVEGIGWMPEVGDGEVCGTTGRSLRLEAVKLRTVK